MKLLAALALLLAYAPAQERARKIVLIAGPLDSHPKDTHEYERNIILLKHCLDTSLKGVRTEVHFNGWPADPATLDDADTIVLTSGGCDRKLEDHPFYVGNRLETIERQMKRGCGLVQYHWSTFNPAKHHDRITEWIGGYFDYETGPGGKWYSKIQTREWTTSIASPDHPIARGVKPFKVKEEFYFNLRFRDADPRLKPIVLCQEGDARANTVGWAVERADGGRGFGFTGGHFYANWWIPEFRKLVLNAIAWTAKVEVPAAGVESTLDDPIRVMILTGHHFPAHDWKTTTPALIRVLEQDPRVRISVTDEIEDLATARIESQDVLILNYMNWGRPGLSDAGKQGLIKFLERGGGFVVFHGATGTWNSTLTPKESDWPEFRTKILARWWDHPKSGHDDFGPFRVEVIAPNHPITEGLPAFDTKDELYVRLAGDASAEALVAADSKVAGRKEPLAWAHAYGKGRVFETSLGHAAESVRKAGALFRRGTVWAAGRNRISFDPPVEQTEKPTVRPGWAPRKAVEPPKEQGKAPTRALIITGHNHPAHDWRATTAAVQEVLAKDIRVEVTENPEDLATAKLDGADVLVLNYCNWDKPGLTDAAKRGLLKYLARGGGLSIIHFANGAFNPTIPAKDSDWEEYRTKIVRRVWMHPESGHDPFGPFRVEIAPVRHPITEGLASFETTDELYFNQKGSLPIEPLATARSKKTGKDEPMAWAYEVEKARVFQTVLGHSAASIRAAGDLIRRGTLWAAQGQQDQGKLLPPDPGLEGGKFGHWGKAGEKDWVDGRWSQSDVGPFITSALKVGDQTLLRAISVKVGDGGAVFDPDVCSIRAGWTGGFLAFSPARYGLIEMPKIAGELKFETPAGPLWDAPVTYRGLRLSGNRVVFEYQVGGVPVLDSSGFEDGMFSRIVDIGPCAETRKLIVVAKNGGPPSVYGAAVNGNVVEFGPSVKSRRIRITSGAIAPAPEELDPKPPSRWGGGIDTKGVVSREKGPYVVDTLTVPYANPWKALMFLGGLDFFSNGDAAVCAIHGDVWRVSGIDETLEKLTWRRYATGLYQALGLRIVNDQVYVLGRDRITRLKDTDGDGEADIYENFCDQLPTSAGGHDYITCLETDANGNFYFTAWRGLYRVSPDGKKVEQMATGWRNPNGMSVGPDGMITVAPQEGEWTPASGIFVAKSGGYYGYGGPKITAERPLGYEPPLCWIPRSLDNSTGGQVWVTSERWGPLQGQLLNLSFGQSSIQLVLKEKVGEVWQGGVAPFKVTFASGVMRGRFRPQDGQLYVAGSKGWVTTGVRDGCLQRVRYTGGPLHLPVALQVSNQGIRISFSDPLEREIAESSDNWALERWDYRYSKEYGSKEYSVSRPGVEGHDPLEPRTIKLAEDGRSVLLEVPDLRPAMQMRIRYSLRSAAGAPVKGEIASTINRIP